jgi:hypothetical protein
LKIFNFHKITSAIHKNKVELVVNPAAVSDFKKDLLRKQTMRLSEDSAPLQTHEKHIPTGQVRHKSQEYGYNSCLTFEELLLLALQNVPETSQMVLLFDKFLIYIPQMSIYLARLIQKYTGSNSPNMTRKYLKSYL